MIGSTIGWHRILIFDDHAETANLIGEILEEQGFAVTVATDPAAAITRLEREAFSLVLADFLVGSPEASERTARRLLAAADATPVGCITAWRLPDALRPAYAFVLSKPFGIASLLTEVERATGPGQADAWTVELMQRYFSALSGRRWSELGSLCRDDVRYQMPGHHPLSKTFTGRIALESYVAEAFGTSTEVRFELDAAAALPRGAVARYTSRWTGPLGEPAKQEGAVLFTFEGGKISTIGVRVDPAGARSPAGVEGEPEGQAAPQRQ